MRILFLSTLILFSLNIFSQGNQRSAASEHRRIVTDKGLNGISFEWRFSDFSSHDIQVENTVYQRIHMKHFTHTKEVGKPALPCYNELVAIPHGADFTINIKNAVYNDYSGYLVHPALKPATDTYGAPEPEFEIDTDFYNTNAFYPSEPVTLDSRLDWRDLNYGVFTFHPVQYNPATKVIRVYTVLEFEIVFTGATRFIDASNHSEHFLRQVPHKFSNFESILKDIDSQTKGISGTKSSLPGTPDYILITHTSFLAAAERLATWKQQLGHRVELIHASNWTAASVTNAVHSRYQSWTPKPDFLLIIGDHPEVPGTVVNGPHGTYSTDMFYVCMNGPNDYVADMAKGRISVVTAQEAQNVVSKIIDYESNPPGDSAFYNTALHAAYFQHAGGGYAERRFAQTAEDLRNYMVNTQGFDVTRVYVTGNTVNPLYWNNGLYSAGEPIPNYLRKPTFPWNGNATHIRNSINSGVSYVLHRDHGHVNGWGDPQYVLSHINQLTNGNKTPIVFSINCLTGKFYSSECFSERFLRKYPGGAVGVFAHAEISYSGFNDGLSMGLIDAIWSSPGVNPTFTGSGGANNPPLSNHPRIWTMGDVANHSLIRMTQTWGTSNYSNSLLHYFGDPAMRIFTQAPTQVTAMHADTIHCGSDTLLIVNSVNCPSCLVTLIVDGETVATTKLSNGQGSLVFPQLAGNIGIITLSDTNFIPYVDTLVIAGGCPKSVFTHQAIEYCIAESITFTDNSIGTITSWNWNFGSGAVPATATGTGPHTVNYTTPGPKTVSLTVTGTASHTSIAQFYIDAICNYKIPASGNTTITACIGKLLDDGGHQNYSNSTSGVLTIAPPAAATINVVFNSFNFENGADFLNIYDGPSTNSTQIGSYTGTMLPGINGVIISSTGSLTFEQITNATNTRPGFELDFTCSAPSTAPLANFAMSDTLSCSGDITFYDISFNGPSSWIWNFGDGDTSHSRNPRHVYQQNGVYNVTLIVSNSFGTDSITINSAITVSRPSPPTATNAERCKQGTVTLQATATGYINWYDAPIGGNLLFTGSNFTTPLISQTTTYYAENEVKPQSQFGAKTDNAGGGGFLAYEHYLVFDCFKPMTIVSVKVYAQNAGQRTIQLKNSSNQLIQSITANVPNGMSRVTLNFNVPVQNNLRLVGAGQPNLYRNNAGLNYPYTTEGLYSITRGSAGTNPTGFYYYFYDWEVREESCFSDRVPVLAEVSTTLLPIASVSYQINNMQISFTNTSLNVTNHSWDFGDGTSAITANPVHTYQAPGNYTVKYIATNDCGIDSVLYVIGVTTGIESHEKNAGFRAFPNPASEEVYIMYNSEHNEASVINLFDISGRLIKRQEVQTHKGENTVKMDIEDIPAGAYILMLSGKQLQLTTRLLINL